MGDYTLADFRSEARYALGGRSSSSPSLDNVRLDRWINATYMHVSQPGIYRHPELEYVDPITLVQGQATYSLTVTYYMLYTVAIEDTSVDPPRRKRLVPEDQREREDRLQIEGEPARYTFWSNQVSVYPEPNATWGAADHRLRVLGYRQPPRLTLPTQKTLIRPEWDEILQLGTVWRGWMWIGEPDLADSAKEDFARLINEMSDWRKLGAQDWDSGIAVNDPGPMGYGRGSI